MEFHCSFFLPEWLCGDNDLPAAAVLDHLEYVPVLEGLPLVRTGPEAVEDDGPGEVVGADGEAVAAVDNGREAAHQLLAHAGLLAVAHQQAGSRIEIGIFCHYFRIMRIRNIFYTKEAL